MRDSRFSIDSYPVDGDRVAAAAKRGQETAAGGAAELLATLDALTGRSAAEWNAFTENLVAAARMRASFWLSVLGVEIANGLAGASDPLRVTTDAWRQVRDEPDADPLAVWSAQWSRQRYPHEEFLFLVGLAVLIDPFAGLCLVETLPSPAMMSGALMHTHVREDGDLLVALLNEAPRVFDVDGRWLSERSITALLLVDEVLNHAQALHGIPDQLRWRSMDPTAMVEDKIASARKELETREIPNWLRRAFLALIGRVDGRCLAIAVLGRTTSRMVRATGWAAGSWSVEGCAFEQLASVARDAGIGVTELHKHWLMRERLAVRRGEQKSRPVTGHRVTHRDALVGEGARHLHADGLPILIAATEILFEGANTTDFDALWSWFEELLVGRDPGLAIGVQHDARNSIPNGLGGALAKTSDPRNLWNHTYRALEPQRRRAQFGYRYDDHDIDLPSRLLLRVGLHGAGHWSKQNAARAREFFFELFDHARRLWLTVARDDNETLIPLFFAFLPAMFGDEIATAVKRLLPFVLPDPVMTVAAAMHMSRNGTTAEALRSLFRGAGANIDDVLRDAQQWLSSSGQATAPDLATLAVLLGPRGSPGGQLW